MRMARKETSQTEAEAARTAQGARRSEDEEAPRAHRESGLRGANAEPLIPSDLTNIMAMK